jgi:ketosteroid isomerase-like protein
MAESTLTPEDVQTLKDITQLHLTSGIPRAWDAWVATCTDDVMLLPPGEAKTVGKEAARNYLEGFPVTLEFSGEPALIKGSGDMAFTIGHARGKFEIDGEAVDIAMKWLAIYERQADGRWKMLADMWNGDPL